MKSTLNIFFGLCALWALLGQAVAQGPMTLTFEGPPYLARGSAIHVQSYSEAGFWFAPIPGTDGFVRQAGGIPFYPENGTTYLQATLGDSLMFAKDDWSAFGLVSVNLAEYSTVVPDAVTVPFLGYRPDGSIVSASFTTDRIIDGTGPLADFQTFHFDPSLSGLVKVEIPAFGWSLDNLVISVPESSSGALLILAGGVFALRGRSQTVVRYTEPDSLRSGQHGFYPHRLPVSLRRERIRLPCLPSDRF